MGAELVVALVVITPDGGFLERPVHGLNLAVGPAKARRPLLRSLEETRSGDRGGGWFGRVSRFSIPARAQASWKA